MNMSVQDGAYKSFGPGASVTNDRRAYNLGWKFSAVLQWGADPSILAIYENKRRPVAQELLAFDLEYAQTGSTQWIEPAKDFQQPRCPTLVKSTRC